MKQLPDHLFVEYANNPLGMDEKLRKFCNLPESKYYTVSVWPIEGQVRVTNVPRVVKSKKISKSDQT